MREAARHVAEHTALGETPALEEKETFHNLMSPAQAERDNGTPELLRFTHDLQAAMAPAKEAQSKDLQAPRLTKPAPAIQPKVR